LVQRHTHAFHIGASAKTLQTLEPRGSALIAIPMPLPQTRTSGSSGPSLTPLPLRRQSRRTPPTQRLASRSPRTQLPARVRGGDYGSAERSGERAFSHPADAAEAPKARLEREADA
jgi:hypothetical protein